jgi:hypothetical protein
MRHYWLSDSKKLLVSCLCTNPEHSMIIELFEWKKEGIVDDVDLNIYIHLQRVGFFQRIKNAFSYIIGRKVCYEEILLDENKAVEIKNIIDQYLVYKRSFKC